MRVSWKGPDKLKRGVILDGKKKACLKSLLSELHEVQRNIVLESCSGGYALVLMHYLVVICSLINSY